MVLGYPLSRAMERLAEFGIMPSVIFSAAPGRGESDGELRVVSQNADGSELVACAFQTRIREEKYE